MGHNYYISKAIEPVIHRKGWFYIVLLTLKMEEKKQLDNERVLCKKDKLKGK